MKHPAKILVIGPAWVGDMVMAQTLFLAIKNQSPNTELHVLAPPWSEPLLARMPEVTQSLCLPLAHGELGLKKRWAIAQQLKKHHYQQSMVLPNSWKSALIPYLAGIPKRTGWLGEWRWGLLNDARKLHKPTYPLMIQRFVALAYPKDQDFPKQIPFPKLVVSHQQSLQTAERFKISLDQPVLALCPGAEFGPAKRWPTHHYATVAQQALTQGQQVWLLGSAKDQAIAQAINRATQQQCLDLSGRTQLGEAIDLLALADQVVSNDSGLMHIAAALDKKLVVVYGSTSPDFTPPLNQQKRIVQAQLPCSPCFERQCRFGHLNCLQQISPKQVIQALGEL